MTQDLRADEEQGEERPSLVMLEACGRALVVLAGQIDEQLELGHALSATETVEIRELAVELMTDAAEILAAPLVLESQSGGARVDRDLRLVRLRHAAERIVDTSASARDFSASLHSAADLIRSTRQEDDLPRRVGYPFPRPIRGQWVR
jgi:hypothetical protein